MFHGLIDTYNLRIGFGAYQTGESIARIAAYAAAFVGVLFVEHNPHRDVERLQTRTDEIVGQLLNAWLMANGGPGVLRIGRRFSRVFSAVAVDLIEILRLSVVGLEIVIADRPRRRNSSVVTQFTKIFFAQSEQCSPITLCVAAHVVVEVRSQL